MLFGYGVVTLDKASIHLTAFRTAFRRFIWNRLPFGLKVSSEVFQTKMVAALSDLPGVYFIADDVIVVGTGEDMSNAVATHDENVNNFLYRCKKHAIVLHPRKFKFRALSVPFMGNVLTKNGLKADPENYLQL